MNCSSGRDGELIARLIRRSMLEVKSWSKSNNSRLELENSRTLNGYASSFTVGNAGSASGSVNIIRSFFKLNAF